MARQERRDLGSNRLEANRTPRTTLGRSEPEDRRSQERYATIFTGQTLLRGARGLVLVTPGPRFYSHGDEAMLFRWLSEIPCVSRVGGEVADLHIGIRTSRLTFKSLNELVAVFARYNLDMEVLSRFASGKHSWLKDYPEAYWYSSMFPSGPKGNKRQRAPVQKRPGPRRSRK